MSDEQSDVDELHRQIERLRGYLTEVIAEESWRADRCRCGVNLTFGDAELAEREPYYAKARVEIDAALE